MSRVGAFLKIFAFDEEDVQGNICFERSILIAVEHGHLKSLQNKNDLRIAFYASGCLSLGFSLPYLIRQTKCSLCIYNFASPLSFPSPCCCVLSRSTSSIFAPKSFVFCVCIFYFFFGLYFWRAFTASAIPVACVALNDPPASAQGLQAPSGTVRWRSYRHRCTTCARMCSSSWGGPPQFCS